MNTAIDARWIFPEISGVGAYTRELIRHLAIVDTGNTYTLIFNNENVRERTLDDTGTRNNERFKPVTVPWGIFSPGSQFLLPRLLREMKIDLYHSTNYMIPLAAFPRGRPGRIRCVTTIHDVIPMIYPDHAPRSKKTRLYPFYRRLMIEIGKRSDAIITDSKASAEDIIRNLEIPQTYRAKVRSVYCGVSDMFKPTQHTCAHEKGKYILYVGRSDPYKNITMLVNAFNRIQQQSREPVRLTVAGSIDRRYPEAQELADELGMADKVTWTGYVSDKKLLTLYQDASLLIHPSRYEGFGLQILEAMACGTPVICADKGAQPEVAGDAAVVLDPDDEDGFVKNALDILNDPAKAESMRQNGLKQASRFTWANTAAQTLSIYEQTYESQIVNHKL